MKTILILSAAAAAFALAGCAEREQTASGIKSDAQPWQGTSKQPPFMAAGSASSSFLHSGSEAGKSRGSPRASK